MNSKEKRKQLRHGMEIVLKTKRPGLFEDRVHTVLFKKTGARTYTCAGHNITVKSRHEVGLGLKPEYYLFEESGRIADSISEVRWTLEYEFSCLWLEVEDLESKAS